MKTGVIIFSLLTLLSAACVTQFIPDTDEDKDLLVVEGLITNLEGINTVKLSRTLPLASKNTTRPAKGYTVSISDDLGNTYMLTESTAGTYTTDPAAFRGVPGRKYQLNIKSNEKTGPVFTYRSIPAEMKPMPARSTSILTILKINAGSTAGISLKPGNFTFLFRLQTRYAG